MSQSSLSLNLEVLPKAVFILEAAGYIVTVAPPELWQHRHILNAWNPATGDGYLLGLMN